MRHRCLRKSSRITHADQSPHNADLVSLAPSRIWRALITPGYSQIVQLGVEWPIEAVWSLTLHGATRLNRGFGKDQSGTDGVSGTLCLWTLDPDTECRDSLRYPRKSRMCRTTGQTSQASPLNHPASPSMPPTPSGTPQFPTLNTRLFHHSLISPEQIIVPACPCVNESLASSDQASSSIQSPYGAAGCQWRPLKRIESSAFSIEQLCRSLG